MASVTRQRYLLAVRDFLVDQRVKISCATILWLIVQNLLLHNRPRDIVDFHDSYVAAGLLTLVCGLCTRSWAAGVLPKGKALATTGPYRLCRHPLYLGSLLTMAGFCFLIPDVRNACVLFATVVSVYFPTMLREENRLANRYGPAWTDYTARTPAFLVPRPRLHLQADWSFAQWRRSREYRAAATALLALAFLQLWHATL